MLNFNLLEAPAGGNSGLMSILLMVALIAVMYFVMIRPQKKREKEEAQMRNNLEIGDEVVTIGGIYGRVVSVKEDSLIIESSADRTKIKISRTAVGQNLTAKEKQPVAIEKKKSKKEDKE